VQLFDSVGPVSYARAPRIWRSGGGRVEPRGGTLAEIAPGEEVVGLLMVNANALAPGAPVVKVLGTPALQPRGVAAELYEFVKATPPFIPTMSLHVQVLGGGIWLANPQNDKDLDPTSVKGLGVRVAYHMFKPLSIEVDVVGASSGESRFEGVDFNGQQGDLLRNAKLGRVSFGGALRMSSGPYIPVLRLGLGLQGASHTAELEVGGVRMPGPEVGFEFDALWYFGGGLDLRLGDSFVLGAALSFDKLVSGPSRSFEAGVHLGYSWKP
jgi:hypothetical protein